MARSKATPATKTAGKKRERDKDDVEAANGDDNANKQPATKQAKMTESERTSRSKDKKRTDGLDKSKLYTIMSAYGVLLLQDLGLDKPNEPTPETILALVLHAMLTSTRILHELAYRSVKRLIEAGYHNLDTLKKSTWQARTEVLTEGGYTRYREKTATALGELAEFVQDKYDGDLNNLLKRADSSPVQVRKLIGEVKGIGKVGTNIFFDTAQSVWPPMAPFIDPRSMNTASKCGLGSDVSSLWQLVGKDPVEMCKLASALTTVRLEKKEKEFL